MRYEQFDCIKVQSVCSKLTLSVLQKKVENAESYLSH